jgi:5,10-methylenetetrahydromethanopterin reductase
MTELWTTEMHVDVENIQDRARQVEREGWAGMQLTDSQNRSPETYVALTAAALATERIHLGLGVTNPVTRVPALAAACASTIQRLTRDRMTMTIGRGDSAAAHIGSAPMKVAGFQRYLSALHRYLAGEAVLFGDLDGLAMATVPPIGTLGLAGEPDGSSLEWMRADDIPVPLEVVSSGPKVLGLAVRYGNRPMLAVGATPERVEWALSVVREHRLAQGADVDAPVGAYVNVVAHDDPAVARRLIMAVLPSTTRFSVMHGKVNGPTDAKTEAVFKAVREAYDMKGHGTAGAAQSQQLNDEFASTFGIAGTAEHVRERITQLAALGISKFVLFPRGRGVDQAEADRAREVMAEEVLPAFTAADI